MKRRDDSAAIVPRLGGGNPADVLMHALTKYTAYLYVRVPLTLRVCMSLTLSRTTLDLFLTLTVLRPSHTDQADAQKRETS